MFCSILKFPKQKMFVSRRLIKRFRERCATFSDERSIFIFSRLLIIQRLLLVGRVSCWGGTTPSVQSLEFAVLGAAGISAGIRTRRAAGRLFIIIESRVCLLSAFNCSQYWVALLFDLILPCGHCLSCCCCGEMQIRSIFSRSDGQLQRGGGGAEMLRKRKKRDGCTCAFIFKSRRCRNVFFVSTQPKAAHVNRRPKSSIHNRWNAAKFSLINVVRREMKAAPFT